MIERASNLFNWLRGRLWLMPALMSIAAFALAYAVLAWGKTLADTIPQTWWLYGGDAGTARDLLSTLLSGIITITALVVSITMVVLTLAANQLGPRLIWNFIEDRRIQAVIGLFVASILYTLLVLRSIEGDLGAEGVPHIAITVASVLTVACLFALLFLVNILAHSIISDTVVREVAGSLETAVRGLPEDHEAPEIEKPERNPEVYSHRRSASVAKSGYVQLIDYPALCQFAAEHDLLLVLRIRAGHFVLRRTQDFEIRSNAPIADDWFDAVRRSIVIGAGRTPTQDVEYSVRQLVEIAVRALSPSLNDPFTAIAAIDRLSAALELAATKSLRHAKYRDETGTVRVLANATDFEGLVDVAFNQIRQAASSKPAVLIQLARRLGDLLRVAATHEQSEALTRHLRMLERAADGIPEPEDRDDLLAAARGAKAERARGSSTKPLG